MSKDYKSIFQKFSRLIASSNHEAALSLLRQNGELAEDYAIGGLTWVQHAIDKSDLATVQALIAEGFDIHALDEYDEQDSLSFACQRGNLEIVDYCLDQNVKPSMAEPIGNPLFASIPAAILDEHPSVSKETPAENYVIIVKKLLDYGIDSTLRYEMPSYGGDIDAMMFALLWHREDIAHLIAVHQAGGDDAKADQLLNEAKAAVNELPEANS